MAKHLVRLRINKVYMHPHSGIRGGKPVDDLLAAGIKLHADRWRSIYGIDYQFLISRTAGFPVLAGPVVIKGQHYRGVARSGHIMLHNAWVPAERRWSDTFWARDEKAFVDQVGIILHHECAHYWFRYPSGSHAVDRRDLMHAWVGRELTETRAKMAAKFGTLSRTKAQAAAAERKIERALAKSVLERAMAACCNGRHCYPVEV